MTPKASCCAERPVAPLTIQTIHAGLGTFTGRIRQRPPDRFRA